MIERRKSYGTYPTKEEAMYRCTFKKAGHSWCVRILDFVNSQQWNYPNQRIVCQRSRAGRRDTNVPSLFRYYGHPAWAPRASINRKNNSPLNSTMLSPPTGRYLGLIAIYSRASGLWATINSKFIKPMKKSFDRQQMLCKLRNKKLTNIITTSIMEVLGNMIILPMLRECLRCAASRKPRL